MMRPSHKRAFGRVFAAILVLVLFLFVIFFDEFQKNFTLIKTDSWFNRGDDKITTEVKRKAAEVAAFSNVSIIAKGAYVFDIADNKMIFGKNENTSFPLASIAKLMTALVATKVLSGDETIVISTSSLMKEGDNNLLPNEKWRFEDLRDFTLLVSSNDGANAIAKTAAIKMGATSVGTPNSSVPTEEEPNALEDSFVKKMNSEATALNLLTLHYLNESGLDATSTVPGAMGSAEDVGRLFSYIIKNYPDILEITKYKSFKFTSLSGINHNVINTDDSIDEISHVLASKTGYTDLSGGSLVVAYDPGFSHPVVIVILGSTRFGRFEDMIALASSTSVYLKSR